MQDDRRLWIYAGLAIPEGVAAARASVYRTEPSRGAALIGDDRRDIMALLQALSRLPLHRSGGLSIDLRPGTDLSTWLSNGWIEEHPLIPLCDVVLVALSPDDQELAYQAQEQILAQGAKAIWLPPAGIFAPDSIAAPMRGTAAEIASWAGRVFELLSL
jgi:hypothetical protein